MTEIVLEGKLGKEFGNRFCFEVSSVKDIIAALRCNFGARFLNMLGKYNYHIKVDDDYIDESLLDVKGKFGKVVIYPLVNFAGGDDLNRYATVITGVVLVGIGAAISFFGAPVTGAYFINAGLGSIVAGGIGLLIPQPELEDREDVESRSSFIFNGAVNKYEAGGSVPIVYGEVEAGSTVIQAGINVEKLDLNFVESQDDVTFITGS